MRRRGKRKVEARWYGGDRREKPLIAQSLAGPVVAGAGRPNRIGAVNFLTKGTNMKQQAVRVAVCAWAKWRHRIWGVNPLCRGSENNLCPVFELAVRMNRFHWGAAVARRKNLADPAAREEGFFGCPTRTRT